MVYLCCCDRTQQSTNLRLFLRTVPALFVYEYAPLQHSDETCRDHKQRILWERTDRWQLPSFSLLWRLWRLQAESTISRLLQLNSPGLYYNANMNLLYFYQTNSTGSLRLLWIFGTYKKHNFHYWHDYYSTFFPLRHGLQGFWSTYIFSVINTSRFQNGALTTVANLVLVHSDLT
jgi:hypothetical protein